MKIYRQEKIEIFFLRTILDLQFQVLLLFFLLFCQLALAFVCKNEAVCVFVVKCKF